MSNDKIFVRTKDEAIEALRNMAEAAKLMPKTEPKVVAKIYMVGGRVINCDVFILNLNGREIAYHELGTKSHLSKIPFYDVEQWEELP